MSQTRFSEGAALAQAAVWLSRFSALWIFAITLLICADITGRTVFATPIRGVTELVSLSLVAIVFLGVTHGLLSGRITRAEVLIGWLETHRASGAALLNSIYGVVGAVLSLIIAFATWPLFTTALRTNEFLGVEGDFTVVVWPVMLIVVVGSGLLGATLAVSSLHHAKNWLSEARGGLRALQDWRVLLPLVVLVLVLPAAYGWAESPIAIGIVSTFAMLALIFAGMPISFGLMLPAFIGIWLIRGDIRVSFDALALVAGGTITEYVFAAVPLFVLMGMVVGAADIGRDSLEAAQRFVHRVKGGLGIATIAANALFAAITGISIASAAIFAKVAVGPMVAQGFSARFAVGLVAGSSVLGMLIPPSLLLIIYGIVAEVSIAKLFIAAILPGLVLSGAFMLGVILLTRFAPGFTMASAESPPNTGPLLSKRAALLKLSPAGLLIVVVLGGIYGGVFTPTEAGAAGTFAALGLALIMRRLSLRNLGRILIEASEVSVAILFLIISASAFARMLTLSQVPMLIGDSIAAAGLPLLGYMAVYLAIVIVFGMVLDSTSILLVLLPLALPAVRELGGDPIWFGIVTVIGVEIGLLTPPLGLSVYVIKSALDRDELSLNDIFAGAMPFTVIMLLVTILLILFPSISLVLL